MRLTYTARCWHSHNMLGLNLSLPVSKHRFLSLFPLRSHVSASFARLLIGAENIAGLLPRQSQAPWGQRSLVRETQILREAHLGLPQSALQGQQQPLSNRNNERNGQPCVSPCSFDSQGRRNGHTAKPAAYRSCSYISQCFGICVRCYSCDIVRTFV